MTHPLAALEQIFWHAETRYDRALMEAIFAADLVEFGRSGRRYKRDDLLPSGESQPIDAVVHELHIIDLSETIALVTYRTELHSSSGTEWANRSSLWDRASGRWQLRFHQGTPCEDPT